MLTSPYFKPVFTRLNQFYPVRIKSNIRIKDICTGADRTRRSVRETPFDAYSQRDRRSPSEINEPAEGAILTELKPTFMSKGPIIMDEVTVVGKGTIEALQIVEYDNGKFYLENSTFCVRRP